jgi:4-amino-4-deoxy-L-arabinose transferase-like glycosyltransferase
MEPQRGNGFVHSCIISPAGGIVLLGVALFLVRSWDGVLLEDPVRYASVAKSILATGDWITMHEIPSVPYFNKPPLYFWMTAALFNLFGVSVWAARFWSAASGIGAMLLLYGTVRLYRGPRAGLMAAVILGLSADFLRYTAVGRLDGPQTFFMALAVWGYARATQGRRRWAALVPGIAAGLCVLTKGPLILAFLAMLVAVALVSGHARAFLGVRFWAGILLGAVLAAPWHIAVGHENPCFWDHYVGHEMVGRLEGEWLAEKSRWIFVRVLLEHELPWTLPALYGIWLAGRYLLRRRPAPLPEDGPALCWHEGGVNCTQPPKERNREFAILFLGWLGIALLVAFLPPRMYGRYLVPVFPPLAGLAALGLERFVPRGALAWLERWLWALAVAGGAILLASPFSRHKDDEDYRLREIAAIIRREVPPDGKVPLYLVEIHAPRASVYFYSGRESILLSAQEQHHAPLVLTSRGGMRHLAEHGYVARVNAEKLVLAGRKGVPAPPVKPPPVEGPAPGGQGRD